MNEQITNIVKAWRGAAKQDKLDLIRDIVKTGQRDGIKLLSQIVSRDNDIEVRQSARKAYNVLYRYCFGEPEKADTKDSSVKEIALDQIYNMLADGDPDQEFEIMTYLQERPIPEAVDYLREHYLAYTDDRVKATLVKTIGMQASAADVPIVYTFLEDESPRVRANAIEALEYINHPNTYSIYVQWLSDTDNRVKANCIKALRRLGSSNVNRILDDMLHSDYVAYKESALYVISLSPSVSGLYLIQNFLAQELDVSLIENAINIIQDFVSNNIEGADEYLSAYYGDNSYLEYDEVVDCGFDEKDLDSEDPDIVLKALSRILENQYVDFGPQLAKILNTHTNNVKIVSYLIRILGEFNLKEFLPQILPYLNSEDDRVRANTVETIGSFGKAEIFLEKYLNDPNNRVRANAIIALNGSRVDPLQNCIELAYHSDPIYKRSAIFAMKHLKNPKCLDVLSFLVRDKDEFVRNQALEVIQFYEICGISEATRVLQNCGVSLYQLEE
jgi:HEAT repeat protein